MRIRTRLAVALSLATAGSFLACAVVSALIFRGLAFNIFAYHQMKQTQLLGAVAANALGGPGEPVLRDYMRSMTSLPGVLYVYLVGADGKILLHTDGAYVGRPLASWQASESASKAVEFKSPVASGGRDTGVTARVGFALGLFPILLSEVAGSLLPQMIALGLLAVALSTLIGMWMAAFLSRPIQDLVDASRRLGAGDLAVQVPGSSSGEMGELAAQFNAMARQLRSLDELKDEFVAGVSHDLRNPLAAIKMNLEYMLKEDPDRDAIPAAHRGVLIRAMGAATRLGVFVTNILDSAKMKAGRMEYRLQAVSVEDIARDMEALYGVAAKQRRISLRLELPAGLPTVSADPERLEHVLSNLISNALKFTDAGGTIVVAARAVDGAVELSVADTGKGIAKEALPRLFERFEQAGGGRPRAKGERGTGLGLFIVKQTIEAMGGAVKIDSEPGRGTTVTARLKQAERPAAAPAPAPARSDSRLTAKILVVDDDADFSEVTRLLLEAKGYRVEVAGDGVRAVQTALSARPDLILMDMDLGGETGANAIRRLKESAATARIPVIVCSASRELPEITQALESGAECFLAKPLKSTELYLRIEQALKAYRA